LEVLIKAIVTITGKVTMIILIKKKIVVEKLKGGIKMLILIKN